MQTYFRSQFVCVQDTSQLKSSPDKCCIPETDDDKAVFKSFVKSI